MADLAQYAQLLANGVILGAILALCAIGLTLVYGILNLSNFAHGDSLTLGAYLALYFGATLWVGYQYLLPASFVMAVVLVGVALLDQLVLHRLTRAERVTVGLAGGVVGAVALVVAFLGTGGAGTTNRVLLLATLLSVVVSVAFALTVEVALWRPLRRRGATVLSLVIASLGLSLVMRNFIQYAFGGDFRSFDRTVDISPTYFGVYVSNVGWLTLGVAVVLIALVHVLLTYTRVGKAMRALADNRDLAKVCGIDTDRIILYVWAIGAALVAVAGVLLALVQNNNVNVNMGFGLLIPIFASVLLGGIGSPYGAMLGGLIVGVAMRIGPAKYDLAVAFAVLIAVLIFRPQGLLGRKA